VDLTTDAMEQTECEFSQEQIEASAKILANMLLDYVKGGGNAKEMTPDKVFGKRGGEDE